MTNELLTINEVARLAGVHRAIVYRWIKLGKIPYVVIFKSEHSKRETIRFNRSVVTEQIQNINAREPAIKKRQYDIPRYVMDYMTAMSKKHRDTPTEILKFLEKYTQQLSANHLQRSSDANNC